VPYNPLVSARAAFACLVCAAACLAGCRAEEADPKILVHAGGVVRRSDFLRHLDGLAAGGVSTESPPVRRALLEAFLEERVLVLEARSRGFVAAGAAPADEQRAVRRMLYEEVLATTTVTHAEIAAYYRHHKDEFRVPETATVRQILVASINEARDIRRRLQRDPKNFEILARTHSRSPEAGQGGLLGSFARGELPPELDKVAFSLTPGSQVEIVATPYGQHVVRVDSRTPEHVPTLEECRDRVQAAALRQKQDDSVRKYIRALMARAKVNYEAAEPPQNHR
jgi:parvulin-like peptidyl-prolyl isomerase